MNGLPYYKRYSRDFLDGIQGIGPELIGAYTVILDLMYARDDDELRRDDRHLAGVMGCSIRKARSLTDKLIAMGKLHETADGFIVNSRAKSELKSTRNRRETRVKQWRNGRENKKNQTLKAHREESDKSIKKKNTKKKKTPRTILETVLTPQTAADVIDHRNRLRKPLTDRAAELLAEQFRQVANPCLAADMMIERGWQGFKADWYRNASEAPNGQTGISEQERQAARELIRKSRECDISELP